MFTQKNPVRQNTNMGTLLPEMLAAKAAFFVGNICMRSYINQTPEYLICTETVHCQYRDLSLHFFSSLSSQFRLNMPPLKRGS